MNLRIWLREKCRNFLSYLKGIENRKNKKIEIENDVESILNFFRYNGVHTIRDYHELNDLEKSFIKSMLRTRDKYHQVEVEFKLELELANKHQLRRMLKMYEEEENYEKCLVIKRKLDS